MNWRTLLPLLAAPICVACFEDKEDEDEDEDDGDDSGYDWGTTGTTGMTGTTGTAGGGGDFVVSVTWGDAGVRLDVTGGPGAYWWGLAETAGCDDCWTGEDCVYGYALDNGTLSYCHDAGDSGTTLTYGGDAAYLQAGTTVVTGREWESNMTYFLESDPNYGGNGSCWVWGNDPSYYDGLGCTQL